MKLSVEITSDWKFKYSYTIGDKGDYANAEMPLTSTSLELFSSLLTQCKNHEYYKNNERLERMKAKVMFDIIKEDQDKKDNKEVLD